MMCWAGDDFLQPADCLPGVADGRSWRDKVAHTMRWSPYRAVDYPDCVDGADRRVTSTTLRLLGRWVKTICW